MIRDESLSDPMPDGPPSAEDEVKRLARDEHWPTANARRVGLIRKLLHEDGLTSEEQDELDRLDAVADARVEPMDRMMIAELEKVISEAKNTESIARSAFARRQRGELPNTY